MRGLLSAATAEEQQFLVRLLTGELRQGALEGVVLDAVATAADVPAAIMAAFSYDTKVLLERHVAGRDLAVSVLDGPDAPEALPVVEAIPEGDAYDFEARYEIGRTRFSCPADLPPDTAARAQELALAADAAGIGFDALVGRLVDLALRPQPA